MATIFCESMSQVYLLRVREWWEVETWTEEWRFTIVVAGNGNKNWLETHRLINSIKDPSALEENESVITPVWITVIFVHFYSLLRIFVF